MKNYIMIYKKDLAVLTAFSLFAAVSVFYGSVFGRNVCIRQINL